ncbi:MAG: dethiobiotin synthase [Acidimicrobiia bacterium]
MTDVHAARHRPRGLVLVSGTGTGVGKTFFAAVTLGLLRDRGLLVAARKPVQSFDPGESPLDSEVLAASTGEEPGVVCPTHRSYERSLAPPMAAEALGLPAFTIGELASEIQWPDGVVVGMVEGAGGPRSPLAADGDTVDLARAIAPDLVVIVVDAGLGAINAARVSAEPFEAQPVVVALNRFDDADDVHRRNADWLGLRAGLDVVTSPTELATRVAP